MAKLVVRDDRLVVRLSPVERFLDLRLRSPAVSVSAVQRVAVLNNPKRLMETELDFGFAGNTAPLRGAVTASSRAKYQGGRAAVFVYARGQCVQVDIGPGGGKWRLFLLSSNTAKDDADDLRRSLPPSVGDSRIDQP